MKYFFGNGTEKNQRLQGREGKLEEGGWEGEEEEEKKKEMVMSEVSEVWDPT